MGMDAMTERISMLPAARVKRILDEAVGRVLTSTERHEFFPFIVTRSFLSEKQEQWLARIENRIFNREEK